MKQENEFLNISDLKPKEVFAYFEEICRIPHGSYNMQQISDYLVEFAKKEGLSYIQDQALNVIICKPASPGYEDKGPVILQGHMDMVAVKDADCCLDLENEGLELEIKGQMLTAKGTSLGGDDGIALAMMLALLSDKDAVHPALECIFTVNEEVGMDGANAIDVSMLQGKRLLNLDNEEEGQLLVSCAGGALFTASLQLERENRSGLVCEVQIAGLQGGHSGQEIDKERANAILLLTRVLKMLSSRIEYLLIDIWGGEKDNAIPNFAAAKLLLETENPEKALELIKKEINEISEIIFLEYKEKEPGFTLKLCSDLLAGNSSSRKGNGSTSADKTVYAIKESSGKKLLNFIYCLPNGVLHMSKSMPGLVETSLNLGVLSTESEIASFTFCVRSSIDSAKEDLLEKLSCLCNEFGADFQISGKYPGWKYQENSKWQYLIDCCYQDLFGTKMDVVAIHAGVECGFFLEKIPGLEAVSIGPNIYDIHTTRESLDIPSVERCYQHVKYILEKSE